jgi:murein DD-endopeptidase MepM/ murein hydrolase activator NlpD
MKARRRVLTIVVVAFAAFSVFVWRLLRLRPAPRRQVYVTRKDVADTTTEGHETESRPAATVPLAPSPDVSHTSEDNQPFPSNSAEPVPSPSSIAPQTPPSAQPGKLLIPVSGVRPEQLRDTFTEARSEGRVHDAIDIPAPKDTPVLAAADGKVVKLFLSEKGGITLYQLDPDNKTIYYYAHLDKYADGLAEGHFARQGETIAYVGDTGNAGPGNYHLHFSISIVSDPKRYWDGTNINPYPLLTGK